MTYELAKELKDAGFPQRPHTPLSIPRMGIQEIEHVDLPTLSELIEACGEERIGPNLNTKEKDPIKHLFRLGWCGDEWYTTYEFYQSSIHNDYGLPICEYGETPEIAVARLWLALNKK